MRRSLQPHDSSCRQIICVLIGIAFVWVPVSGNAIGQNPTAGSEVYQVLKHEANGDDVDRTYLANLNTEIGKWQAGNIKQDHRWLTLNELDQAKKSGDLLQYEARRDQSRHDEAAHRDLALWCESHDLLPQAKAHWNGVLGFNSDDLQSRDKLRHAIFLHPSPALQTRMVRFWSDNLN